MDERKDCREVMLGLRDFHSSKTTSRATECRFVAESSSSNVEGCSRSQASSCSDLPTSVSFC